MRMIRKIELQLKQKLGRQLSVEELAKVLDMDLDELKVKIRLEVKIKSMHEPLAEDFNLEAILPDPTAKVEEAVVEKGLKEIVEKAIAQTRNLKDQERQVLTMRYLQGDTVISLAEVGRRLFLTRERVRQIENKALNKLAQGRYCKELRRYLDDSINL